MNLIALTLSFATAFPQQPKIDFRLLVTHDSSLAASSLLQVKLDELPSKSSSLGYNIWPHEKAVVIWDENLMDLKSLSMAMEGQRFIASLLRAGKLSFRMGDLTESEKKAVRQLFIQAHQDRNFGQTLWDDDLTVSMGMDYAVEVESNGVKKKSWMTESMVANPQRFPEKYSVGDIESFIEKELPKLRTDVNINGLFLKYRQEKAVKSEERLQVLTAFILYLEDLVKKQNEEYSKVLVLLENAHSTGNAPTPGMKISAINREKVSGMTDSDYKYLGFSSQNAARTFLDSARVTSVQPCVSLTVLARGVNAAGVTFQTWLRRRGS